MAAIEAEGLTKRYGATLALDALDLRVEPGEVYGYHHYDASDGRVVG